MHKVLKIDRTGKPEQKKKIIIKHCVAITITGHNVILSLLISFIDMLTAIVAVSIQTKSFAV